MKEINEEALKDITGGVDAIECIQQQCKDYTDYESKKNCVSNCLNDPNIKTKLELYKVIEK